MESNGVNARPPTGRLIVGGSIFVGGFLTPLLVPVIAASGLPAEWKALIAGLLVVGVPELFMIVAVAILGKQGFEYLKSTLLKSIAPPEHVSRGRYRLGLVLFLTPLVFGWVSPYLSYWLPEQMTTRLVYAISGDLLFVASFFVLGGEFWDKLRALFFHDAKAHLPPA